MQIMSRHGGAAEAEVTSPFSGRTAATTAKLLYSALTQLQVLTGQVMKLPGQFQKGKKSLNILQQEVLPLTEHLHQKYRTRFEKHTAEHEDWRKQKASAWYYVTYNQVEKAREKKQMLLLSFAWVMHDVLCLIKRQAMAGRH
jgi:hypothetical protein